MYSKTTHKQKKWKLVVSLVVFCAILVSLSYVGMQMYILTLENTVREIRKERSILDREIIDLKIQVANLRKGSRIRKIALEQFGMEMPEGPPEILFLMSE